MSEYGVTSTGFIRKNLTNILSSLNSEMKSVFGDALNLEPESPDGQINAIMSEAYSDLWEIAEIAFNSFDPTSSYDLALDRLVRLNHITRLKARPSSVELTLYGDIGREIPSNTLISTSDTGSQFATSESVTIGSGGSATITANSVDSGAVSALAGTLTVIDTPVSGLASVTNLEDAVLGRDRETDPQLRARREKSVAISGKNTLDSIYSQVANVEGVLTVSTLENRTKETDSEGLPASSFSVIVIGGDDDDIAQAIFDNYPTGIEHYGNSSGVAYDIENRPNAVNFSRPDETELYLIIDLDKDSDYPENGDDTIKQAILDYANGDLVVDRGFGQGDDVIVSRLYTPINTVNGHNIVEIRLGDSPNPTSTNDYIIATSGIASFSSDRISII